MKKQVLLTIELWDYLTVHDTEAAAKFIAEIVSKRIAESPVTAEFGSVNQDGKWIKDSPGGAPI